MWCEPVHEFVYYSSCSRVKGKKNSRIGDVRRQPAAGKKKALKTAAIGGRAAKQLIQSHNPKIPLLFHSVANASRGPTYD